MKILEKDKLFYNQYQIDRLSTEYLAVFQKPEPLVSVIISSYNSGEMLVNYSLKSVLEQTYKNLQIIVIADGSTDETDKLMSEIKDSRIIYQNIKHVDNPNWFSTGTNAINAGLKLCSGDYIAHLDDDDFFVPEKIEKLVEFNKKACAEIIHHPFTIYYESPPHTFDRLYFDSNYCTCGQITVSTLFYHGWFKRLLFLTADENPQLPGDWDKCERILSFGGKSARHPDLLTLKNGHIACIAGTRNRIFRPSLRN